MSEKGGGSDYAGQSEEWGGQVKTRTGGSAIQSGKEADRVGEEGRRYDGWQDGKENVCTECARKTAEGKTKEKMDGRPENEVNSYLVNYQMYKL